MRKMLHMNYQTLKNGFIGTCVLCDSASVKSMSDKKEIICNCPNCGTYIFKKEAYACFSKQKITDYIFYKHLKDKLRNKVKTYAKQASHVCIDTDNLSLI